MGQFVSRIHGPLGPDRGCPEVRNAVMATTTVEFLSDSSNRRWEISGILARRGCVQEEEKQQFTRAPLYIVYAHEANSSLCWRSTCLGRAVQLRDVSIPNNVRELCNRCFHGCESLLRVTFGASSSLERIGVLCFAYAGVEEVSIPDGVRELGDRCFYDCKSLRRVMFGSSSSLERIGVCCFAFSSVEEVNIPDGVRELCDSCFYLCEGLRRVNFGSLLSLERIGFQAIPMSVSCLCDPVRQTCCELE